PQPPITELTCCAAAAVPPALTPAPPADPLAPKLPPAPPPPPFAAGAVGAGHDAGFAPAPSPPAAVLDASSVPMIEMVFAPTSISGRVPLACTVPVTSIVAPAITHSAPPGWQRASLSVSRFELRATSPDGGEVKHIWASVPKHSWASIIGASIGSVPS